MNSRGLGISVESLPAGMKSVFMDGGLERVVVLLAGTCDVRMGGAEWRGLGCRRNVFDGPASALYVPPRTACEIVAREGGVELAVVSARSSGRCPPYVVFPETVRRETRGTREWKREVHDIITENHPSDSLLVGETFSTDGVWSGYPPHRHDRHEPGHESRLDEVFLVRTQPATGFAVLVHYPEEGAPEKATVYRDGDTFSVNGGFHSIVSAAGYRLYYLWALSGDARKLNFRMDGRHQWVKDL